MNDTYVTTAWSLFAFLVGLFSGGAIVLRLHTDTTKTAPETRRNTEWARRDIRVAEPELQESFVRLETSWNGGSTDGRTISFSILDRNNIRRDMTFTGALLWKFFKSGDDGPRRSGFKGDNSTYSQLLAVGRHYRWISSSGSSYEWTEFLRTRERRLRVYETWMTP